MKNNILEFIVILISMLVYTNAMCFIERPLGDLGIPENYYDTISDQSLVVPDYDDFLELLPSSFDWRDHGAVTPAKDQGACGSCWAFASVGALESKLMMTGKGVYDLSEQQMVSCNTQMGGCSGGTMAALQFYFSEGPMHEICTDYMASNIPCSDLDSCEKLPYRTKNYYTVYTSDINEIKVSLYKDGPTYFRFDVYADFFPFWDTYSPGSVYTQNNNVYKGGHAVLIIGWSDVKSAWLCKNSWGESEGPNGDGTFWIAQSGHNDNLKFGMANINLEDFLLTSDGSAAYDPSNNRYLVVYQGFSGICGQFRACNGTPIGEEFYISNAVGIQQSPSIAYDGINKKYLVIWVDLRNRESTSSDIYGQLVNDDGTLYGSLSHDNFPICTASEMQDNPTLSYNTVNYNFLVVWQDYRYKDTTRYDIFGQLLEVDYSPLDGNNFCISMAENNQINPKIAFDEYNNKFLLAWTDYRNWDTSSYDIYGMSLNDRGLPLSEEFAITAEEKYQTNPSIAYDDKNHRFLVAWVDHRFDIKKSDIYGRLLDVSGNFLNDAFPISDSGDTGWAYNPTAVYDNEREKFMVAWMDERNGGEIEYHVLPEADIYGQFLYDNGIPYFNWNFHISSREGCQSNPSAVYNTEAGNILVIYNSYKTGAGIFDVPEMDYALVGESCTALIGDLDGNGCVDRTDLNIMLDYLRGPDPHNPFYDFNNDGVVNIADARTLVTFFTNDRGEPCP